MIQAAPEVVNDVTEDESPVNGERISDLGDAEHDAVTPGVVVLPEPPIEREIGAARIVLDAVLEHLGVEYRHRPLEPRAL